MRRAYAAGIARATNKFFENRIIVFVSREACVEVALCQALSGDRNGVKACRH